jgi:sugar-specific transcriptional regulator TrmB
MDNDTSAVRTYFSRLGLAREIADIYLALHSHGPQTISELARNSHVERTRIYRLIDTLLESSLVEVESHHKRGVIKAAPISNVRILIAQKEQELKSLQDELGLVEQVLARNSLSSPTTRVQFYHGIEGVRQLQWNQTRSKTEVLTLIDEPIQATLGKAFTIRWAEEINRNKVTLRLIQSPHFCATNANWYKREKIPEIINELSARTIQSEDFKITCNMDIWDNVVAYYDWKNGEIFGIEIYNQGIADAQRAFFETLWQKAKD